MDERRLTLEVDTGKIMIDLKDETGAKIGEFGLNPSDVGIVDRFRAVIDFFNGYGDSEDADPLDQASELNRKIGEQFDYLLGENAHEGIFGKVSALSLNSDGDFFFEGIIEGLGGIIEQITKKRVDKKLKKIKKYTDKYAK